MWCWWSAAEDTEEDSLGEVAHNLEEERSQLEAVGSNPVEEVHILVVDLPLELLLEDLTLDSEDRSFIFCENMYNNIN